VVPSRAQRLAAAIVCALLGAAPLAAEEGATEIELGALTRCIRDSGALFYGAHWCPVCRAQKESFERYAGMLPYVECYDGPKSAGINARCKSMGIQKFPTWVFRDFHRKTGALDPLELGYETGCIER
jgi:hypothetical protein